uniref:Dead box ATP-dependent RNA helicase n=1 Tax=Rhizophora mucronata TaxID=61149 RepID=A0A2P2JBV3_RHIMU
MLLRRDGELSSMKPDHPRAIVLCNTEEQSEEGFCIAKFISDFASNSHSGQLHPQNVCETPIGLLVGNPGEVLQQMDERSIYTDDVKYLVLDEADSMFDHGFGPEISKIISPSENHKLKLIDCGLQTIMVTSTITKILGKKSSPFVESLEHDNAGKVTATLLELDQTDVIDILECPDALKKKVAETLDSLASGS